MELDDGNSTGSTNLTGFDIVTSRRGKPVLLRGGYSYNKRRTYKDNSTKWLCTKRNICKAILVTSGNNAILKDDKHDCKADFASNQLQIELEKCTKKVTTDVTVSISKTVREAVAEITDNTSLDLITKLSNRKNIERKLYRKRNSSRAVKKVFVTEMSEGSQ
ncbi:hypothetical protein PYW07_016450 [Mythimna separata]|uniref:FLYWCH-type domain-containing protein n=1 Tax=Mythimna separata TaxID=271217 RepID=A0AAD8DS47_MYTSE|nr:hypothetical protein PYW07_016450 [Mythimna separata]